MDEVNKINMAQKPEAKPHKKTIWEILKGGFIGIDNEGSSKRLSSFYVLTFLITPMICTFIYAFIRAIHMPDESKIAMYILGMFITILGILFVYVAINSGLTSIEQITNLWKTIKGQKTDDSAK